MWKLEGFDENGEGVWTIQAKSGDSFDEVLSAYWSWGRPGRTVSVKVTSPLGSYRVFSK